MVSEATSESSMAGAFWRGARLSVPVMVASGPFAMLFGAIAVDNDFSVFEAFFMSAAIFGGASQMVGIELFGQRVAPWLIVLSIFAVNFRHVLYSAAIGRHLAHWPLGQQAIAYFLLTDPQYALAESQAQGGRKVSFAWYMGLACPSTSPGSRSACWARCSGSLSPTPARSASISCCRSIFSAWSWISASGRCGCRSWWSAAPPRWSPS